MLTGNAHGVGTNNFEDTSSKSAGGLQTDARIAQGEAQIMSTETKVLSLTGNDLKEILKQQADESAKNTREIIAAMKAPTAIEQQKLDQLQAQIESKNQERREQAELTKQNMANEAFRKKTCAHEGGKPTHSHVVFVSDDIGGYCLCQACRAVIRPENQLGHFPKDFQKSRQDVIFDTGLFNKVFQKTDASGVYA
jgi:hypothetical protein